VVPDVLSVGVTPATYARPMMNSQLGALVAAEVKNIPRGDLSQNIYRMAYQQARLNGLGAQPEIAATPEAAHEIALQVVREHDPNFSPSVIRKL
jgi:hypothetical protein